MKNLDLKLWFQTVNFCEKAGLLPSTCNKYLSITLPIMNDHGNVASVQLMLRDSSIMRHGQRQVDIVKIGVLKYIQEPMSQEEMKSFHGAETQAGRGVHGYETIKTIQKFSARIGRGVFIESLLSAPGRALAFKMNREDDWFIEFDNGLPDNVLCLLNKSD